MSDVKGFSNTTSARAVNTPPKGWEVKSLADISTFIMGQAPLGSDCNKDNIGIPFVKAGEFSTSYPVIREWTTSPLKFAELGDVLICVVGATAGKLNLGINCAIGRSVAAIRPSSKTTTHYLYNFMLQHVETLRGGSSGSAQGVITREHLKDIIAPIPPLPEQQKIAAILSSVDEVIERTQAQINKLKDLKTGMMQELLSPREGQATNINNPQGESKNGLHHTEFKDSPLGRIPVGWEVDTLDILGLKILDGDRGSEYPKEKDFNPSGYCLFLSAKNVTKNGFKFNEKAFITIEKDNALRKGKLVRGDIVITTRGTVGNIVHYDKSIPFENIRINSGMAILRNEICDIDTNYLLLVLTSPLVSEQIKLMAFGSAQPQLTIGVLKNLIIPMPSFGEQIEIAKAIDSVKNKLLIAEARLQKIIHSKKALMQDLLTGKVRVNVD